MRILHYILSLLLFIPSIVFAQAEYLEVRDMFSKPNAFIPVQVWKGLMFESQPVEFFIGERDGEVNGYYRLISSGEKFFLEGEVVNDDYVLSEHNNENEIVGSFILSDFREAEADASRIASWYNLDHSDVLPFKLKLGSYSDYPPSVCKPFVKKFSGFNRIGKDSKHENYLIEILNEQQILVHYGNQTETWKQRVDAKDVKPLRFEIQIGKKQFVFEEIGRKLKRSLGDGMSYFALENEVTFRKIAYADDHFIYDVDFPVLNDQNFNTWIEEIVEARKQSTRKIVNEAVKLQELSPAEMHFKYKWLGWTEIDLLTDEIVSGRIVFSNSWSNGQEVIPFTYNLTDGESIAILDEFKKGFNAQDYLNNMVQQEIDSWKGIGKEMNPTLNVDDFVNLTVSDYHLIVSNDFDRIYGYEQIEIPLTEFRGSFKRSSILKNLRR